MRKIYCLIFLLFVSQTIFSQNVVDEYNVWLQEHELSKYLFAESVYTQKQGEDNFQILKISYTTESKDTANAYLKELTEYYAAIGNASFPERLFYSYLRITKSKRPDTLVVQLIDKSACNETFIYYNETTKQIVDKTSVCQSKTIQLNGINVRLKRNTIENLERNKKAIFNKIVAFSDSIYTQAGGLNQKSNKSKVKFKHEYINGDDTLFIVVSGLKQEILVDYSDDFTCWLLSWFYDEKSCYPWEYLKIKVAYKQQAGKAGVKIIIDGKLSDGTANSPLSWGKAREIEGQFSEELDNYARTYRQKLSKVLY